MDRTFLLATLLTASLSTFAHAATIDVPSDTPSINTALALAGPGGKVIVDEGTYFEHVTFPFVNQTLEADGKVIIDGGGGGIGIYVPGAATGAKIEDMRVRNCFYGIYIAGDHSQVDDCEVTFTTSVGVYLSGVNNVNVDDTKIKDTGSIGVLLAGASNCVVEDSSVRRAGAAGMLVLGTLNSILRCKVSDSTDQGIQVGSSTSSATGILLEGNKITRAGKDAIACSKLASNCTLQQNTTRDATYDGIDINWMSNGHMLLKNKVSRSGDNGLEITGDSCTVKMNKSKHSWSRGISVSSPSNFGLYVKNKVKFSTNDGIGVWGTANTFTQNKFKASGGFDRFSGVALASNTWLANIFSTSNL